MFKLLKILIALWVLFAPFHSVAKITREERANACAAAKEHIGDLHNGQYRLSSTGKGPSLLELEQALDRATAHLTMLKGMRKLNKDYLRARDALASSTIFPTSEETSSQRSNREQLLALGNNLTAHQDSVEKVKVASSILSALSNESLRKGLLQAVSSSKNSDELSNKTLQAFQEYCQHRMGKKSSCRTFMKPSKGGPTWKSRGDSQVGLESRMASLLALAVGDGEACGESDYKCIDDKSKEMVNKMVLYRDTLYQDINETELGGSDFSRKELEEAKALRDKLSGCRVECKQIEDDYFTALNNYRSKVLTLYEGDSRRDWESLADFKRAADNLRGDSVTLGSDYNSATGLISNAKIESFVHAGSEGERLELESGMTEAEKAIGRFQLTRKQLLSSVVSSNREKDRNKMRQQFNSSGNSINDLFNKDLLTKEKVKNFNDTMSWLVDNTSKKCDSEECSVAFYSKDGKFKIDDNKLFDMLNNLTVKERLFIDDKVDAQILRTSNKINEFKEDIMAIRASAAYQDIDALKSHFYNSTKVFCGYGKKLRARTTNCNLLNLPTEGGNIEYLLDNMGKVMTHFSVDSKKGSERELRKKCKNNRYGLAEVSRACATLLDIHHREVRPTKAAKIIKKAKESTRVYDRDGNVERTIHHNNSGGSIFGSALSSSIQSNPELIGLLATWPIYDNYLDEKLVEGQIEKQYAFNQEAYRKYWMDYYFNGQDGVPPMMGYNRYGHYLGGQFGYPTFSSLYFGSTPTSLGAGRGDPYPDVFAY